jgi:hypothetical protein
METLSRPLVSAAAPTFCERPAIVHFFEIAGRLLLIECRGVTLPGLEELLARYYCILSQAPSAAPDATIRLHVEDFASEADGAFARFEVSGGGVGYTDGRTCLFDFRNSRIIVHAGVHNQIDVLIRNELDLQRLEDLQVMNYAISTALRRCDLYELHGGAVVEPRNQRGVLFVGPSGSGKSTLTLQLVANGWQYLSDDVLLLKNVDGVINAFPLRRAFAVTQATVVASGELRVGEALAIADWSDGSKRCFMPSDFFPENFSSSCRPQIIFFPTITGEDETVIRPLTHGETMIQLIKRCPWSCYDPVTSTRHLGALSSLAKQADGFMLLAGRDLLRDPGYTLRLVTKHLSSEERDS